VATEPFLRRAAAIAMAALLGGCSLGGGDRKPTDPPDVSDVPDPVVRSEPRSRYGNPPFYEVYGVRYHVLESSHGFVERGVASWYGKKFHGRRTSSGETYDMYAMTAAHKTLPLPAYARVTNLSNGRSVVVRINDRGPFIDNRIVDLSYTAAEKLDMIGPGTAFVELVVLSPDERMATAADQPAAAPPPPQAQAAETAAPNGAMYVQAGAFSERENAESLATRLRAGGLADVLVADDQANGAVLFRVRIGPVSSVDSFDWTIAQLEDLGIRDAYLATH